MVTSMINAVNSLLNPSGELTKAFLTNVETNERIEFLFNPTEYALSKTNNWDAEAIIGFDVPPTEFQGGDPTTLDIELFFDTYEKREDVRNYTDKVFALTKISDETRQNSERGRPPRVLFNWGRVFSFQAVITELSVTYTLFLSDGTPVRASMELSLQECEDATQMDPQNPTSQGTYGNTVHVVKPGESIDLIATMVYGDPKAWRVIADANSLDNPKDLQPGTILEIVPLAF